MGAWRGCLIFISGFAALVNCGILWLQLESDANLQHHATELWTYMGGAEHLMELDFEHSNAGRVALAVMIEHFILIARFCISELVEDTPVWVQEQAALNDKLAADRSNALQQAQQNEVSVSDI